MRSCLCGVGSEGVPLAEGFACGIEGAPLAKCSRVGSGGVLLTKDYGISCGDCPCAIRSVVLIVEVRSFAVRVLHTCLEFVEVI